MSQNEEFQQGGFPPYPAFPPNIDNQSQQPVMQPQTEYNPQLGNEIGEILITQ